MGAGDAAAAGGAGVDACVSTALSISAPSPAAPPDGAAGAGGGGDGCFSSCPPLASSAMTPPFSSSPAPPPPPKMEAKSAPLIKSRSSSFRAIDRPPSAFSISSSGRLTPRCKRGSCWPPLPLLPKGTATGGVGEGGGGRGGGRGGLGWRLSMAWLGWLAGAGLWLVIWMKDACVLGKLWVGCGSEPKSAIVWR